MDIEKERKAFEAIAENIRLLRGAKFKDGEYVALSLFDESSKELAAQLNYGWAMWLAAKANASESIKQVISNLNNIKASEFRPHHYDYDKGWRDCAVTVLNDLRAQEPTHDLFN